MRKEELLSSINNRFFNKNNSQSITKTLFKNNKAPVFSTGTTTVGLICKDAVVLGTDRRATMAYFIASKIAKKLHKIQDHLWMTIAGSVADAQYLIDVIKAQSSIYQLQKEKPIPVKTAGKLLSNFLYRSKMFPFEVGLILGGVTKEEGPTLLDIGAYGSILPEKYVAVGSGQNFSYGVLEAKFKENLSIEEGKKLVRTAVTSSISRDMNSGNGINIVVIKAEGSTEEELIPM